MNKFVQNILFCDDVRAEQSGKDIAIGIYNGYIVLPQIPFVMNLAVRLELNFLGDIQRQVTAKFQDPTGNDLAESQTQLDVFDWQLPLSVTLAFSPLILPIPGQYKLFLKFDGDWEEFRTLNVQKFDPLQVSERMEMMAKRIRSERSVSDEKRPTALSSTS